MFERRRILVACFESSLRATYAALLEQRGYRAIPTGSCRHAIDILRFERVDLLLADYTITSTTRELLLMEARRRSVRALVLKAGGSGEQASVRPDLTIVAPDSPGTLLTEVARIVNDQHKTAVRNSM